ncbi:MAG: hypothetical protein CMN31_00195 [Sandaracinus sp.]|nr:hypothetical protein [Myxococcales bacterium]MAT26697.1 hypothetical protein [Sandaracinus sp.]MBJ69786.1 hypothetical protein [Sandaracinus sp.]HJL28951.1 hypothetical protein [Polyangiaceae bacterium LLY-WYZ-15_(1-7)]HJL49517.1 hypothetical protein [Polyangiaceae bacterium LLY-WYZ-15_(1-7)]
MLALPTLLGVVFAGCAPTTVYRRAALVPTPGGDTLSQPLERPAEISGTVHHTDVETDPLPQVGDPGLQAARTTFTGQVRFRLGDHVRLGGQLLYSHASLAQRTAVGTPPMDGKSLFGIGPQVGFAWRTGRFHLGGGLALTLTSVPWTTWERRDGAPDRPTDPDGTVEEHYREVDSDLDMQVLVSASVAGTWVVNEYFEAFVGLSVQNSLSNIGFDDQSREGSTLDASTVGVSPFVGATARIPGGAFVRGQYYLPLNHDQFYWGEVGWGGVAFTLGVEIGDPTLEPDEPEVIHVPPRRGMPLPK